MSYEYLTNLHKNQINRKSVLIIGSGFMAEQYSSTLYKLGITNVTIIGHSKNRVSKLCKKYEFTPLEGGFIKNLPEVDVKDLVIVATPTQLLVKATEYAIKSGQKNILIEKPGALYSNELKSLKKNITSQKIRLAYNRLCYPSFHKLIQLSKKEGGITSCNFTFTEWINKIKFHAYPKIVLSRWGISNSLHVISMVMKLIGMPKKINCLQKGTLPWHKSGAIFVGSGISKKNIPFSYHSDWYSSGRWGIEVMTKENSYRLMPLEQLFRCKKGSTAWEPIYLKKSFVTVKEGIAEEIFSMLDVKSKRFVDLVTLKEGSSYITLAEKIFGY